MTHRILLLSMCLLLWSCEGYYKAKGTVYENKNGDRITLDSTMVKVYCGLDWLRGNVRTDVSGKYELSGLTKPGKATYYIIFEKTGFKTDTLKIKGKRGKTGIALDHTMTRIL